MVPTRFHSDRIGRQTYSASRNTAKIVNTVPIRRCSKLVSFIITSSEFSEAKQCHPEHLAEKITNEKPTENQRLVRTLTTHLFTRLK